MPVSNMELLNNRYTKCVLQNLHVGGFSLDILATNLKAA